MFRWGVWILDVNGYCWYQKIMEGRARGGVKISDAGDLRER